MPRRSERPEGKLIVIAAFPDVQMLDLVGPIEIFAGANELLRRKRKTSSGFYRMEIVTRDGRPVRASNGR